MSKKSKFLKQKISKIIFGIAIALFAVLFMNFKNGLNFPTGDLSLSDIIEKYDEKALQIHFVNVGQGDCSIILNNRGEAVMIDTGPYENRIELISYLDLIGVKKIKYLVFTHPHSDHIGAGIEILNNYKVEKVLLSDVSIETTVQYEMLLNSLEKNKKENGTKIILAKVGDSFLLSGAKFEILAPKNSNISSLNNSSIVLKMQYNKISALFTGDIEKLAEEELINSNKNISADILKVPHHGSSTSSCKKFLEKVKPNVSVISCGIDNMFNHPNFKIVKRLNEFSNYIYRTDLNGWICIVTNGKEYSVCIEKNTEVKK